VLVVKNVDLIGVTLDELGGEPPAVGTETCLQSTRDRVVNMKPPKEHSSCWRGRTGYENEPKWEWLVARPDEPNR
jgi:hypothetical protein